ncbi:MAG: protoglobin domain-containing protein, partial [Rivularia sp. (in: cyanobacteria)]
MAIEPQAFLSTLEKRVCLTAEDKALLQSEIDWGKEIAPDMAEFIYAYLGRDEEMNTILSATEGRAHRLKETFIQWFYEMFTGMDDWGSDYAVRRWQIGLVHVRLGIGPQHVVPAMATVIREAGHRAKKDDKSENIKDALSRI